MLKDNTIENLLELDGVRYVIEEHHGLWVKFEAKKVEPTHARPHGIKYSLTLHDRYNCRLIGFDNAHAIDSGVTFDHCHRDGTNKVKVYVYRDANKLLEDFWQSVEKVLIKLEVPLK